MKIALVILFILTSLFTINIVYEYIHTFNSRKLKPKKIANDNKNLLEFFLHVQILQDIIVASFVNFLIKIKLFFHCIARFFLFNKNLHIPNTDDNNKQISIHDNYDNDENIKDVNKKWENVQVKTIYFIRHSESIWNSIFNRTFSIKTFLNFCLVLLYEVFFFFSKKSALIDSPLSNTGIIQSIELSNFLQHEKGTINDADKLCAVPINSIERTEEKYNLDANKNIEMSEFRKSDIKNELSNRTSDGADDGDDENDHVNVNLNVNHMDNANNADNNNQVNKFLDHAYAKDGKKGISGSTLRKRGNNKDSCDNTQKSNVYENGNMDNEDGDNNNNNKYFPIHSKDTNMDQHNNPEHENYQRVSRNNCCERYNHKEIINLSLKDHIDILNNSVKYRSAILCSDLRRAISSCVIALYNRIKKHNEQIQVLNSLQEISRNPDCVSLFDYHDNTYISTDIENFVHKDVDRICKKNINVKRNFTSNKFYDTLSYIFNNDMNIFIIFGHSLWFRLFFNYFLKQSHKAKTHKIQNSGVVVFNMLKYDQDDQVHYEIEKDSIRVLYKGFLEEHNKAE
ncbi:hypothetical protein, conserved [Plasmodium gonderi]|uniref:Phosphoglycerate mutase n=1 Tax=Plasmodium gonderi TaxID=77519 RepID=A0A1Y1JL12_PLAGO|nr:hypothetical protein, conserved [Plasmodium gonderi]GAW83121.1 hypothetical protein, conserved [Plasmodium gonderi]